MKKITKDTTLAEITEDAGARDVLAEHEVPCLACPFAQQEAKELKIGDVCKMYGIGLEGLLKDLNRVYKKKD